jgi:hypothetical protein
LAAVKRARNGRPPECKTTVIGHYIGDMEDTGLRKRSKNGRKGSTPIDGITSGERLLIKGTGRRD